MSNNDARTMTIAGLMDQIRALARGMEDPSGFLQNLQVEIEREPGAMVSFSTRDVDWARKHFEGLTGFQDDEIHKALTETAEDFEVDEDTDDRFCSVFLQSLGI